jgi:ankyrin repeat protein
MLTSINVSTGMNQPDRTASLDRVNTEIRRAAEVSPLASTVTSSAGLNCDLESCMVSLGTSADSSTISVGTFADSSTISSEASSSSFCSIITVDSTRMVLEDGGNLPLHVAVSNFAMEVMSDPNRRPDLEQRIRDMAFASPASVNAFNHAGMTPFHVACKEGASYQTIFDLFTIWPHAVSTPTRPVRRRKGGKSPMLPLHMACRYYSGLAEEQNKVISFLLRVYPEASNIFTSEIEVMPTILDDANSNVRINDGDLPLHLYCENHFCNLPVLDVLFKAYPDAIQQRNRHGKLPLHLACERRYFQRLEIGKNTKSSQNNPSSPPTRSMEVGSDIIRYLVKANPDSLLVCDDKKGELPLHAAVRGYQDAATIKYMLKSCPQSIQFVDLSGRTALHRCVIKTIFDPEVMAILLEFDPYATCIFDHHDQGKIPLQYAVASKSLDLIYTLIRSCPMSLEILRNSTHNTH